MFASRKKSKLCYLPDSIYDNRLFRYQNALRRFEEIGAEMQQDYQSDNSVRVKILAKEPGALSEAKKSLKFGDTASIDWKHMKIHNKCQSCHIRSGNYFYILRHNACMSQLRLLLELLGR